MKIKKYTKYSKNKYKVELEDGEIIILYEDIILKEELLLKKEIENLEKIIEENNKYVLYDKALNYLNKRIRSKLEIKNYLKKYTNNEEDIEKIINKLIDKDLLNSNLYLKSYIHDKMHFGMDGPLKIKNDLLNLGFQEYEIEDALEEFTKEKISEKINNYLQKQSKNNKKSRLYFQNKMLINLINLGYEREDILNELNNIEIDNESLKKQEIEKLRKKYAKKYEGEKLERVLKQKLYEKGYY